VKKRLLSTTAILLLASATLSAEDTQVIVGMTSISGTMNLEDASGYTTPDYDMSGSGFEVSIVGGVDKNEGFDFRPVLTLQSNKTTYNSTVDASDIMLLGEFEFAYNINEYISPFVGFYGGVGSTNIPDWDESGCVTADLGLLVGISGAISEDFGYYGKYTVGSKIYNIADDTIGVRTNPSTIKVGISYTF